MVYKYFVNNIRTLSNMLINSTQLKLRDKSNNEFRIIMHSPVNK